MDGPAPSRSPPDYHAGMAKIETKQVTLHIGTRKGAKELSKLLADGWQIVSEHKRGILEWKPGQVDYVLTRSR